MKKLILDYSTWRCGDDSDYQLGEGNTLLLNKYGFMCCLGQFSLQLNEKLNKEDMLKHGKPSDLKLFIPLLNEEREDREGYISTNLSISAIRINDDVNTTPETKIELLKELFAKNNCEIEVINNS